MATKMEWGGLWATSHVDDIKETLQLLQDAGATIHQVIKDVGGGKLIATIEDPDLNISELLQLP